MDEVVSSENYGKALKKVIENKGAFNWSVTTFRSKRGTSSL